MLFISTILSHHDVLKYRILGHLATLKDVSWILFQNNIHWYFQVISLYNTQKCQGESLILQVEQKKTDTYTSHSYK